MRRKHRDWASPTASRCASARPCCRCGSMWRCPMARRGSRRPRTSPHAAAVWRNHHPEQGLSTMADQLINQVLWPLIYILCIVLPLVIAVAMFVYWERKVIGWMHVRLGPNKIGPFGMLQAFADVV